MSWQTSPHPIRVDWDERKHWTEADTSRRASVFHVPSSGRWFWSTGYGLTNVGFGHEATFEKAAKHCTDWMIGSGTDSEGEAS